MACLHFTALFHLSSHSEIETSYLPRGAVHAAVCCVCPVSQTLDDFRQRLSLNNEEIAPLKQAISAIETGNSRAMTSLGMPPYAWNEVSFIFSKLIKSGFAK